MRYQILLRQEVRLAPHEVQAAFRKTIHAVIALGVGLGTASTVGVACHPDASPSVPRTYGAPAMGGES